MHVLKIMSFGMKALLIDVHVQEKFHVQNMIHAVVVDLSFIGFSLIPVISFYRDKC
uniref:Uncharacterized protein n=1 Tax=Arundo donax TaxID=35708 RepID=A0A0A8ZU69_ARUDO